MRSLVITTINRPNKVLKVLAGECKKRSIQFVIVGDLKTPKNFKLENSIYLDVNLQKKHFNKFSSMLPNNHYARKNIGYLFCINSGAKIIQETDDDNLPLEKFYNFSPKNPILIKGIIGWYNAYQWFTSKNIWPRGFPLEYLNINQNIIVEENNHLNPYIFQGLADGNPDVDAIYRMTNILPIKFKIRRSIVLDKNVWCPFNSQNTVFLKEAFPLLYLPSFCSFRMTDIWRSLIAQRCLWEINGGVLFHSATVYQNRNEHRLLNDFQDEISGYLNNDKIRLILENVSLTKDTMRNLSLCYEELVKANIFPNKEILILKEWIKELEKLKN